jgi:diguanylate cyclase (GGDEF)-like protein
MPSGSKSRPARRRSLGTAGRSTAGPEKVVTPQSFRNPIAAELGLKTPARPVDESSVVVQGADSPLPWSVASAAELASAADAQDLFVFRRIAEGRFAHVGGAGRGVGWAGIVEIGVDCEPLVEGALAAGSVVRRSQAAPERVLGPYYTSSVAIAPVSDDVFVVFGAPTQAGLSVPDAELLELARFASEALLEVEPAKRLADEIETLNAVRDLLQAPAGTFEEALQRLVEHATSALSCDLGFAYVPGKSLLATVDLRDTLPVDQDAARAALTELAERGTFPLCIQESSVEELPRPLRSDDGVLAYYLLELKGPLSGVLLLLHTRGGVARGFTMLCQALGARLVDAAEPLLATALMRDQMHEQLELASAQARREPLTEVGNRLAWNEAVAGTVPTADSPVSVVKVDCRGLKRVNDTHGHDVGDVLLKRVAALLRASSRDGDVVARVGGDEFGVVLYDADEATARQVVERIRAQVEVARAEGVDVDLAIGFATTNRDDLEETVRTADLELLESKRSGRR